MLFVGISGNSFAQTGNDTLRVLFVGNSYTSYHSLPQLFEAMAEDRWPGLPVETKFVGGGGATLKKHWDVGQAQQEIETGQWDYVILQEQSMLGSAITENGASYFGSPDPFFHYARLFDQVIKAHGAVTVFYMTWSRRNYRYQQKYLTYAYMTIARELNSRIAPVGLVWDKVRDHASFDLYEEDGSHPSIYGSFLAATTLLAILFDTKPTGISGHLEGHALLRGGAPASEQSTLCDLSDNDVQTIQDATTAVFEQLESNNGYIEVEKAINEKEPPPAFFMLLKQLGTAKGQAIVFIAIIVIYLIFKSGIRPFRSKA